MYLAGNEGAPPREQLARTLAAIAPPSGTGGTGVLTALDIGCGPGREAVLLARAGYAVTAFDPYPEMLERARSHVAEQHDRAALEPRIDFAQATLEEFAATIAPRSFDLIHAGFVLPFVLPSRFDGCFARLVEAMRPGAIFCGQLFGPEDEFVRTAVPGTMSSHDEAAARRLLDGLDILSFEEVNRSGRIGRGREKWWHVFHVAAQRR